jgi:hypothetical protein
MQKNGNDANNGKITAGTPSAKKQISNAITNGANGNEESILFFTYPTSTDAPFKEENAITTTKDEVVISAAYNAVDDNYYETVLVGRTKACERLLQVEQDTSLTLVGLTIDGSCEWWNDGGRRRLGVTDGGALEVKRNGYLKLDRVVVKNITVSGNGGAVIVRSGGTLHLESVDVQECTADNGGFAYLESNATLIISGKTTIKDCVARLKGGAIYASIGAKLILTAGFDGSQWQEIVIKENKATEGGGIYMETNSILSHRGLIIENNKANIGGGLVMDSANVVGIPDSSKLYKGTVGSAARSNEAVLGTVEGTTGVGVDGNKGLGGGIFATGKKVVLNAFNVSNCKGQYGGGIYTSCESAILSNININGNEAGTFPSVTDSNDAKGNGGGIYATKAGTSVSQLTMRNVLIEWNMARTCVRSSSEDPCIYQYHDGGGFYGAETSVQLTIGHFSYNGASRGGGAFVTGSNAMFNFTSSTFTNNDAKNAGGGALATVDGAITYLYKSTAKENIASGKGEWGLGGAVYTVGSKLYVLDSTISKNTASNGGSIYAASAHIDTLLASIIDVEGNAPTEAVATIKNAFPEMDQVFTDSSTNSSEEIDPYANTTETVTTFTIKALQPLGTNVIINNSEFSGNFGEVAGSEISVEFQQASIEMDNVRFVTVTSPSVSSTTPSSQSTTTASSSISVAYRGALAVSGSTISSCTGTSGGYASLSNGGTITMSSMIVENCVASKGGFLYLTDSFVTLTDTTFKNCSGDGAILHAKGSTVNINALTASDFNSAGYALVLDGGTGKINDLHVSNVVGGALSAYGSSTTALSNVTLSKVTATDGTLKFAGSAKATLTSITVDSCTSTIGGGIGLDESADVSCNHCTFDGNDATTSGGAIGSKSSFKGLLNVDHSKFLRNKAVDDGAGIAIYGGQATIANTVIEENEASGSGGGLHVVATVLVLKKVNNTKNVAGKNGGGLTLREGASLNCELNIFEENVAKRGGAAIDIEKSLKVDIYNTTFNQNIATKPESNDCGTDGDTIYKKACSSGGIHISKSKNVKLIRVDFTKNQGTYGGGIFMRDGSEIHIQDSVATENIADLSDVLETRIRSNYDKSYDVSGGGFLYATESCKVEVSNSTLLNNVAKGTKGSGGAITISRSSEAILSELTVTSNFADFNGGQIAVDDSKVDITDSNFLNGEAKTNGGAFAFVGPLSDITVATTSVSGHVATLGGAVFVNGAKVKFEKQSSIRSNKAKVPNGNGGGFYIDAAGEVTVKDVTLETNIAEGNGGAMFATGSSSINLVDAIMTSNKAHGSGGGACFLQSKSKLDAANTQFTENEFVPMSIANPITGAAEVVPETTEEDADTCTVLPQNGGGAVLVVASTGTFNNCIFLRNKATGLEANGGGILADQSSTLDIGKALFEGNTADQGTGGGIKFAARTSGTVSYTKFVANTAINGYGGAIASQDQDTKVELKHIEVYGVRVLADMKYLTPVVNWYNNLTSPLNAFKSLSVMARGGGALYFEKTASLTIENSFIVGTNAIKGGGIFITTKSTATVKSTTIEQCIADNGGGVYTADNSKFYIQDFSKLFNNIVKFDGGAVFVSEALLNLNNAIIQQNQAPNAYGGAVYISPGGSVLTIDSDYSQNVAVEGGAIFAARNSLFTVIGGNFYTNRAVEAGGALSARMPTIYSISGANFTSNNAARGGSMELLNVPNGLITSTHFQENVAAISGGGISVRGKSTIQLSNIMAKTNVAVEGGAVYVGETSSLTIEKSIFNDNIATRGGGFFGAGQAKIVIKEQSEFNNNKAEQRASILAAGGSTKAKGSNLFSCGKINNGDKLRKIFKSFYLNSKEPWSYDYFGMNSTGIAGCMSAGGAGYLKDMTSLRITGSTFKENAAIRGGAIFSDVDSSANMNFETSNFIGNQALQGGGVYWVYKGKVTLTTTQCRFEKNLVDDLSTQSLKTVIGWWPNMDDSLKSGLAIVNGGLNQDATTVRDAMRPYVVAVDYYGNRAWTNSKSTCEITEWPIGESQGSALKYFSTKMRNGIGEFYNRNSFKNGLIVKGDIGQSYNFAISCDSNEGFGSSNAFEPVLVNITIDPCSPGEALDSDRMCAPCTEGTYSPKGENCLDCPEGGVCSRNYIDDKGNTIKLGVPFPAVAEGFWLGPAKDTWIGGGRHCNFLPNSQCKYEGGDNWKDRVETEYKRGWCNYDAEGCVPGEKKLKKDGDCEIMKDVTAERMFNCYTYDSYSKGDNMHLYACPLGKHSCKGSQYECNGWLCDYGVGLPQQANGTGQCNEGYEGVTCGVCELNYFRAGDKTCKTCVGAGDPQLTATLYAIAGTCSLLFMLIMVHIYLRDDDGAAILKCFLCCLKKKDKKNTKITPQDDHLDDLKNAGRDAAGDDLDYSKSFYFRPEKFKIMLSFIQIYSGFKGTYNVTWPWLVSEYMRHLSGFNLDLMQLAALDCIYRGGFYFGMSFVLLITIGAFVLLFIALRLGKRKYHNRLLAHPRRCIWTGKKVKEWMHQGEFFKLRLKAAKEAMDDAELKYDAKLLEQRLHNTNISLNPTHYVLRKSTQPPDGKSHADIAEIVNHNVKIWRGRILERMNHIRYENKLWKLLFWMLLLSYPSISVRVVSFFNCKEIGHEFYLAKDLSLHCFDEAWAIYTPIAILALVLYVAGVPFLFFYVLYKARAGNVKWNMDVSMKNEKRKNHFLKEAEIDAKISMKFWATPITREDELKAIKAFLERRNLRDHINYNRIGFIYYAYHEDAWFYEIVELMRKLILNGFAVLISPGTTSQIVFGLFVCFSFMLLVMVVQPYTASTDHLLAVFCHVQLFLTLFCALMLRAKVAFVSTSVFPDPTEREQIEEDLISWFAVLSHGGLLLFGLFAIVHEKFFSKEIKELQKRKKHREDMRKQALKKLHNKAFGKTSKMKGAFGKVKKSGLTSKIKDMGGSKDEKQPEIEEEVHLEDLDDLLGGMLMEEEDEDFSQKFATMLDLDDEPPPEPKKKKSLRRQATTVML